MDKPLSLVHDPVRGGAPLQLMIDEECPVEMRGHVFDERPVITFHRIKVTYYSLVTTYHLELYYLPLTTYCLLLTTHYSLLTTHYSPLTCGIYSSCGAAAAI